MKPATKNLQVEQLATRETRKKTSKNAEQAAKNPSQKTLFQPPFAISHYGENVCVCGRFKNQDSEFARSFFPFFARIIGQSSNCDLQRERVCGIIVFARKGNCLWLGWVWRR